MSEEVDVLYIVFVDLKDEPKSGSSVRPQKMLNAFEQLGMRVKILDGWNNHILERRKHVKEILKWLDDNKVRMCYIEPPSGPFFCLLDLYLIKKLRKENVPIGLFYRDAYWMFPDVYGELGILGNLKRIIIRAMQRRDLFVFKRNCSHFFFPSDSMSDLFDTIELKSALPPACDIKFQTISNSLCERILNVPVLTYMYVGGASERYGTSMILEAFKKINSKNIVANLVFVCPQTQWQEYIKNYDISDYEWLTVKHISGDDNLKKLYEMSDLSLLPLEKCKYNDFAVPIKLFEYISYHKPVLSTNCTESEKLISKYNVGWVVEDNASVFAEKLIELNNNRESIVECKFNCAVAANENTWKQRAQEVAYELLGKNI